MCAKVVVGTLYCSFGLENAKRGSDFYTTLTWQRAYSIVHVLRCFLTDSVIATLLSKLSVHEKNRLRKGRR